MVHPDIQKFNERLGGMDQRICEWLARAIEENCPEAENKIWHAHPVWFWKGNPIVGYSRQKPGVRLMFWSGADFQVSELNVIGKKFKDASIFYNDISEIDPHALRLWIQKSKEIQWDYKNLIRNRGLFRLE